jgi:hypothetical protein
MRPLYHNLVVSYLLLNSRENYPCDESRRYSWANTARAARLVHGNDEVIEQIQEPLRLQSRFELIDPECFLHQ